jgi:hypothetical protein
MLQSVSDQEPLQLAGVREGLIAAGSNDAGYTPLTAYANTSALRLPQLPEQHVLLAAFAERDDLAIQPNRKELVSAVKLAARAGVIQPEQVEWLANNKHRPAHFYKAAQQLLGNAFDETSEPLIHYGQSILKQWPVQAMTKFFVSWMRYDETLIDENLICLLKQAKAASDDETATKTIDANKLNEAICKATDAITLKLNKAHRIAEEADFGSLTQLAFYNSINSSGPVTLDVCDISGVELDNSITKEREPYWNLLKLCLHLMAIYLQPITLPSDLEDMIEMTLEPQQNDLEVVNDYLATHNLEKTKENVEKALIECEEQIYAASDYEDIESFQTMFDDAQDSVHDRWAFKGATIDDLTTQVETLPKAETTSETAIAVIAKTLLTGLNERISADEWSELDLPCPMSSLTIFAECDEAVKEFTQGHFEHFMNGGMDDDESCHWFGWLDSPHRMMEASNRMTFAAELIMLIVNLNKDAEC